MPTAGARTALAELLERGELVYFPTCPFPLPAEPDLVFLRQQRLARFVHKNISLDPATGRVTGFVKQGGGQGRRLAGLLGEFSRRVNAWLSQLLPRYAAGCRSDRATLRSEEEATRQLRHTARNDLLHIDAFPNRPSWGRRILRVFANIHPSEPRVWVTSEPFADLLRRHGEAAGLPGKGSSWLGQLGQGMLQLFRPGAVRRSVYDAFMLRFHDYLKLDDAFQERGPKRLWTLAPGSAWMAFTDACSHCVLRGRWALEHSFFIDPDVLALPDQAPAALLAQRCGESLTDKAA
jgi:hypothetical protein